MQVSSSYFIVSAGGSVVLIPDPVVSTPPNPLTPFHLVHPEGRRLHHVTVGPITCTQPEPQSIRMCVWAWTGFGWRLVVGQVELRAQRIVSEDRGDAQTLDVPMLSAGAAPLWASALCVIPLPSACCAGAYCVNISATDAPRWPC